MQQSTLTFDDGDLFARLDVHLDLDLVRLLFARLGTRRESGLGRRDELGLHQRHVLLRLRPRGRCGQQTWRRQGRRAHKGADNNKLGAEVKTPLEHKQKRMQCLLNNV